MARNAYAPIDIHAPAFKSTAWPNPIPELTGAEAERAARRLYRWAMGKTFEGKVRLTSGNRRNWYEWTENRSGTASVLTLIVNPDSGWRDLVHDFSHAFARLATPGVKPHSKFHARFEARMVNEVVRRGWLDGKLKDKPKWAGLTPLAQAFPHLDIEKASRPDDGPAMRMAMRMVETTRAHWSGPSQRSIESGVYMGEGGPDDESQDEANWVGAIPNKPGQNLLETVALARATDPLTVKRRAKLTRIQARLERWRKKEARAKKAIAKLVKSEKYYVKALG